ncbi:MAG: MATE family efflux transporter [Clostridia bacterium]|nr:MATE family efflux transporter [Clostridia bacterium]
MKSFYKKFFLLMIPMALKELISTLVNLIDTIMVGRLGETSIAAVGIGNQISFLYLVFLFGISCGAGVFAAQFWGSQDTKGMKRVLGLNIILGMALTLIFIGIATLFPAEIFHLFNANPEVLKEGVTYLSIVSIGYIASAITTAFDMSVCCSERAGLPFIVRLVGLVVNVILNWVLIFGHLGIPAMGVKGAAIATVIARFSELIVMLSVIYGRKMLQAALPAELFAIPKDLVLRFIKTATPVILNEMAWATGITLYSWVFARINPDAMVVITIVQNIERLMLVFFHGSGNAAGVFIGKAVGAKKYKTAYIYGKKLTYLLFTCGVIVSVVFILARPLILLPYNVSASVLELTMDLLFVTALLMIIKAITFLLIVGVFRNGGDTKVSAAIDISTVWLIGVPIVIIGGLVFHLPLLITYILMYTEEIVKLIVSLWRFKSKKWIKNVVS